MSSKHTEFYKLLNVSPSATEQEIKKSFKKLALTWHPDKWAKHTPAEQKTAEDKFKLITSAYQVLSDPEKRKQYDIFGENVPNGSHSMDQDAMRDMFSNMGMGFPFGNQFGGQFGNQFGGQFARQSGQPKEPALKLPCIKKQITLSLKDVYLGSSIDFEVMRHNLKKGKQPTKTDMVCGACKGRGMVTRLTKVGPNMVQQSEQKCNSCVGAGLIFSDEFFDRKMQKYTKVIPKGIFEGQTIVIENQGNEVPGCFRDQYPGQERSDIIITVVEEKSYEIKGHSYTRHVNKSPFNVKLNLQIEPHEAICGTYKNIPYINGESICIEIPCGTIFKNGEHVIVVSKLGIPYYKQKNAVGDLYVILNIVGSFNVPANKLEQIWNLFTGTDMKQIHDNVLGEHNKGHVRGVYLEDFAKSKECRDSETNQRNFDRLHQQRNRQNGPDDDETDNMQPGCQQQ